MLLSSNTVHNWATLPSKNLVVHPIRMECTTDAVRVTRRTPHACKNSFNSYRGKRSSIFAGNTFERFDTFRDPEKFQEVKLITLRLASPDTIRRWAETRLPNGKVVGLVHNANTLHHNTLKPLKGGLFCERIFGPTKDFQCACGIQKEKNFSRTTATRLFCLKCDVEYTWSLKRRYQSGYIRLVSPVAHLWYVKETPSFIAVMLDMKRKTLDSIIYCSSTLTIDSSINQLKNNFLSSQPFSNWKEIESIVRNTEVKNSENSFEENNFLLDDATQKQEAKSDKIPSQPSYFFSASSNLKTDLKKLKKKDTKKEVSVVSFFKKQKKFVTTNKLSKEEHLRLQKIFSSKSLSLFGNQGALFRFNNQSNNYSYLNSFLNWTNLWTIAYKTAKKQIKMEYLSNLPGGSSNNLTSFLRFSKNLLLSLKPLSQNEFLLAFYAQKTSKLFKNSPKFSYGLKLRALRSQSMSKEKSKNLSKTLTNLKKITKTEFLTAKSFFLSDVASFSPVTAFSVLTTKKRYKFDRFIFKNNRMYLSLTTFPVFLHMIMYLFQKCENTEKMGNSFSSLVRKKNILLYSLILKLKYTIKYWSIFKNFIFFQSILIKNNYSLKLGSKLWNIKKQKVSSFCWDKKLYLKASSVLLNRRFKSETHKYFKFNDFKNGSVSRPQRLQNFSFFEKLSFWSKEYQFSSGNKVLILEKGFLMLKYFTKISKLHSNVLAQKDLGYSKSLDFSEMEGNLIRLFFDKKLSSVNPSYIRLIKNQFQKSFFNRDFYFSLCVKIFQQLHVYKNNSKNLGELVLLGDSERGSKNSLDVGQDSNPLSHSLTTYSSTFFLDSCRVFENVSLNTKGLNISLENKFKISEKNLFLDSLPDNLILFVAKLNNSLVQILLENKFSSVMSFSNTIKNITSFNKTWYSMFFGTFSSNRDKKVPKENNQKNQLSQENTKEPRLLGRIRLFGWISKKLTKETLPGIEILELYKNRSDLCAENFSLETASFPFQFGLFEKLIKFQKLTMNLRLFNTFLFKNHFIFLKRVKIIYNQNYVYLNTANSFNRSLNETKQVNLSKPLTPYFDKLIYVQFMEKGYLEFFSALYLTNLSLFLSSFFSEAFSKNPRSHFLSASVKRGRYSLLKRRFLVKKQFAFDFVHKLPSFFVSFFFSEAEKKQLGGSLKLRLSEKTEVAKLKKFAEKKQLSLTETKKYPGFLESVFSQAFANKRLKYYFSQPAGFFGSFFSLKKKESSKKTLNFFKLRNKNKKSNLSFDYFPKTERVPNSSKSTKNKLKVIPSLVWKRNRNEIWDPRGYLRLTKSNFSNFRDSGFSGLNRYLNQPTSEESKHSIFGQLNEFGGSYQDPTLLVTSTSSKSVKNSTRLYNNIYVLSNRYFWDLDEDLQTFLHYLNEPTSPFDVCIPTYADRLLKYNLFRDPTPVLGGGLIQKLLAEFHPNECSKILMVLEKSLKTVNILLKSCDDFLEARTLRLKRNYILRRLKYIRSGSYKFTDDFLRFSLDTSTQKLLNTSTKSKKAFKLKNLRSFLKESRPEWMVLSLLPVLPPDLRPILQIGNQVAASDLNRLYQKVIYRNERLKRFLKDSTSTNSPQIKFAYRLLQEAVDNLIDNGKGKGTPETDNRGLPLKSLTELLKGKKGRFRQNLLGKRVDYSGRSVIVVGPRLHLHECGLPKEMAIELFLPFLIQKIFQSGKAATILGAKLLLKTDQTQTWEFLTMVMRENPVLLNRAPTLHRFGFQAFQPRLVEGKAILLHPLVCPAFNADFDGDQMAVHVPITAEAKVEAWKLMLARNHLLSSSTGEGMLLPSQDMVLGCYYLTATNPKLYKKTNFLQQYNYIFTSIEEVLQAYESQKINLHSFIWLRWNGKFQTNVNNEKLLELQISTKGQIEKIFKNYVIYANSSASVQSIFIKTTPGRVLFYNFIFN